MHTPKDHHHPHTAEVFCESPKPMGNMKGASTSSAGRDRLQRLNFQLTSKPNLTKQNSLFQLRGPSPGETLGCQKGTQRERGLWSSRQAQVRSRVAGDTLPQQRAAGVPVSRGGRWSQVGLAYRPLSSPRCQKEKHCRPRTPRGSRQHPRGATGAGLSTRLCSKPSLLWYSTSPS